jgi:iron(III) transport system substrate-binding protein
MKLLLALVAALGFAAAHAQDVVANAKKEGELTLYTSAQNDDIGAVVKAFEAKYGIKVNMWRAGSEKVLQRAVQEARSGRHTVDVVETNGPEMEALSRENILRAVKSPHHANLIPRRCGRMANGSARA